MVVGDGLHGGRLAGSLEFLLVSLAAAAAPLGLVAATTLIVNLRHVFYALSFSAAPRQWRRRQGI
ncbi:MAG TPA: AzlC family ABC transporter permease [Mycobacterium sp.]|nr:AzlC family ABC transporter permease [Mycobacterium sp.]